MEPTLSEVSQGAEMQNTGCNQKPDNEPPRIPEQNQNNLAAKAEQCENNSFKEAAAAHFDIDAKVKEVYTVNASGHEKVSKSYESVKPSSSAVCDMIKNSLSDKNNSGKVAENLFLRTIEDDVEPPGKVVEPPSKRTSLNDIKYQQKGRLSHIKAFF